MKKIIIIYSSVILFLLAGSEYLAVNVQPSLPVGIYLRLPAKNIKKNDIVIFNLDEKYNVFYKTGKIKYPMKKITADSSDEITIKRNRIFVNGESYGEILSLALPKPNFKIDNGCYFLLSKNQNSFDSRYFGQICKKDIVYKAYFLVPLP